jgi:cytochrome c oxidase subunit 2
VKQMERIKGVALVVLLPLLLTACGQSGESDSVPSNAQKINVVASDWKWTLDKTTVKAGVPVDFHVQSPEGVHGFEVVGTKINVTVAEGKNAIDKVWTFDKPGTYTIACSQYCGSGHSNMFTQFKVQ